MLTPIIKMDIWTFTLFYGELCLISYISSVSFLPHASFEIYELLLPFNLFKCKNVLILLLLKVYEKYDYNSSICTSNDNKLAVTSFKIWLFHKLVPNLLYIYLLPNIMNHAKSKMYFLLGPFIRNGYK